MLMPSFGQKSSERLSTCMSDIQAVFNRVVRYLDCSVLEGHRTKIRTEQIIEGGAHATPWPDGMHHTVPSKAADVMRYYAEDPHIRYARLADDIVSDLADGVITKEQALSDISVLVESREFAFFVKGVSAGMNKPLKWGGDFRSVYDSPHWETP